MNLFIGVFFSPPDSEVRMTLDAVWGIHIPYWPIADDGLSFVAGFPLLDLMYYAVHRCEHAVPFLWRFHALHHSDPDVDLTTSVRHHPVEYLLTSAVYWPAALFLDVPVDVVLGYGLAVFGTAAVQHGNIRLPQRLERLLQPVLVTIDMHRAHHQSNSRERTGITARSCRSGIGFSEATPG